MGDGEARSSSEAAAPQGALQRLTYALRKSLHGNATAFGYSVTITASFGAVQLARGAPGFGDLILFGVGAVIAFGGLEGLLSRGFRTPLEPGADEVITLGTALSFISVGLAICAARGAAGVLSGPIAWLAGALSASLVFALVESVEFMLAQWVQERRGAAPHD